MDLPNFEHNGPWNGTINLKKKTHQNWTKSKNLFSAMDQCVQNSEGSINYNLSYYTETILPTHGQSHNILCPQNLCSRITKIDLENMAAFTVNRTLGVKHWREVSDNSCEWY